MHLIQILLPLFDNAQKPLPRELFDAVAGELTQRFRGLTAYTRAPAEGHWQGEPTRTSRDEIIVYEVMADSLDTAWWKNYRRDLEARFSQECVIVRAQEIQLL